MNLDIAALQPTSNRVLSYNILGMTDSDTLPAWRLTSKNTSSGVLTGFMALAHSACRGLMSNNNVMTQLKVHCCHLQTLCCSYLDLYDVRCTANALPCNALLCMSSRCQDAVAETCWLRTMGLMSSRQSRITCGSICIPHVLNICVRDTGPQVLRRFELSA